VSSVFYSEVKAAGQTAARLHLTASARSVLTFGNPAKSAAENRSIDFRRLCDLRSREVCLYRLSFKEKHSPVAPVAHPKRAPDYLKRRPCDALSNSGGNAVPTVKEEYKLSCL
jgi:hypothetical protein